MSDSNTNTELQNISKESLESSMEDISFVVNRINKNDIENLDVTKLREAMLKSMYVLEHSLFGQAAKEHSRIVQMRDLMTMLEKEIFDKNTISKMEPVQKLQMYKLISYNMQTSLTFLKDLHSESSSALETLNNIEKTKANRPVEKLDTTVDRAKMESVKKMIENEIKLRLEQKKIEKQG